MQHVSWIPLTAPELSSVEFYRENHRIVGSFESRPQGGATSDTLHLDYPDKQWLSKARAGPRWTRPLVNIIAAEDVVQIPVHRTAPAGNVVELGVILHDHAAEV